MSKNDPDALYSLPLFPAAPKHRSKLNAASQELTKTVDTAFQSFSVVKARKKLTSDTEQQWIKRGEKRALALFHAAARHVPAYKDFLASEKIKPASIKTIEDFKRLPIINKKNYLAKYPIDQLTWYGDLPSTQMISVSSGSSGEPFFWPRGQILDAETTLEHELFLTSAFQMDQKSTLFLVCFAMGMYVAGPITANSVLQMGLKGYPVTVATPGYSPDDVLRIIPDLAPKYDQLVLAGYPPYIKEIIDQGIDNGIDWKKFDVRFLLAGEGFNEAWRTHVAKISGDKSPTEDFINLYGSADAAVLAHETMASIIVRRRIADDAKARQQLYGSDREPSLLQYHPEHKYFEEIDSELLFTAPGGIPLIRYNIHDSGGILLRKDITAVVPELEEHFSQLESENKMFNLPFVFVYGKSDQTVTLYGANVYPENIKRAIEDENLRDRFTGKFVMYTDLDRFKDQRLNIEIECSRGTRITRQLQQRTVEQIVDTLLEINSEFRSSFGGTGEKMNPRVELVRFGDERFNASGVKQKWTR